MLANQQTLKATDKQKQHLSIQSAAFQANSAGEVTAGDAQSVNLVELNSPGAFQAAVVDEEIQGVVDLLDVVVPDCAAVAAAVLHEAVGQEGACKLKLMISQITAVV